MMIDLKIFILLVSSSSLLSFFVNGRAIPTTSSIAVSPTPALSPTSLTYNTMPFPAPNPHLNNICRATDHPEECMTSIALFQTGESDPVSVLKMEIQALRLGFQNASSSAKKISDAPTCSETCKSCLDSCVDLYESGIYDLDDAVAAIAADDVPKLKAELKATISYINSCDEVFLEEPDLASPLRELDVSLRKIASNSLAIVDAYIQD